MKDCNWDDAFAPTPEEFHGRMALTLNSIKEENHMKKRYKVSMIAIAAMLVLALAGGIALAAGMGVFDWVAERWKDDAVQARYERLSEMTGDGSTVLTSADGRVTIDVSESYFGGGSLYVGYQLRGDDAQHDITPDAELKARIKAEGMRMDDYMILGNTPLAQRFTALKEQQLTKGECACFVSTQAYLSDYASLTVADEQYELLDSFRDSDMVDGVEYGVREYSLPESAADADAVEFTFWLLRSTAYYYKDADGVYMLRDTTTEPEQLTFSIARGNEDLRRATAHVQTDDYDMDLTVTAGDVDVRVRAVYIYTPTGKGDSTDSWDVFDDLRAMGKDALVGMELSAGGESMGMGDSEWSSAIVDGARVYTAECVYPALPDDTNELTLTPQWAISGADDAIVITMD